MAGGLGNPIASAVGGGFGAIVNIDGVDRGFRDTHVAVASATTGGFVAEATAGYFRPNAHPRQKHGTAWKWAKNWGNKGALAGFLGGALTFASVETMRAAKKASDCEEC